MNTRYGAGDAKIGSIINGTKEDGKVIKKKFLKGLPSLEKLIKKTTAEAKEGYVTSLDGRKIRITKSFNKFSKRWEYDTHKALNSLLQSSGAILAKTWGYYTDKYIKDNYADATIVVSYHDEMQIECKNTERNIDIVYKALRYGVEMADNILKTNCPNDIDIKQGRTWNDTH